MIELGILALVAIGLVVLVDRKDRRMLEERKAWQLERANLIQRIQAPEAAVAQHATFQPADLPAVNPHDDADYWAAQEEALQRIERLEREGLT